MSSRSGLWWDDLEPGRSWSSDPRTVTARDVSSFADLTGDDHPLHTDADAAAGGPFGGVVAHGLLGLSLAHGLMWASTHELDESAVAFLGIRDWQFLAPIRPDDEVRVEYTVVARSSAPGKPRGVVEFDVRVLNQHDDLVQSGVKTMLISRKVVA
ncbi:MAG: MaoC/PaaZ C-terminal domain-containing protein [Aeromicrobium sp.]|uniref:MaoC family dehydratase n=1 Tax=Aeromicrobium sp. TaxID=1871063 RepID=UPI00260CB8FA|nr:MaoC/PaaZ C-terminal domain-containing protein [Aeromicrobium sp.]MDF1704913.1 MaoC/PaaZ C-terminal domain-containing protein [Aeromicrobium sp.]